MRWNLRMKAAERDRPQRARPPLDLIQLKPYYSAVTVLMTSVGADTLHRIGRALADPTRRLILLALLDGPGYPAEFADQLATTRANLSNHLTCLRECGLVTGTAEGRHVRYDFADPRLADSLRLLASLNLPGHCKT